MNRSKMLFFVLISLMLHSSLFSKTNDNILEQKNEPKLIKFMFEIGPVYNMFSFEDNPISENEFYSTQIRMRTGIMLDDEAGRRILGFEYIDSKQLFRQNNFDSYRVNLFFEMDFFLGKRFRILTSVGLGFYRFKYVGVTKYSSSCSAYFGIGYQLSRKFELTLGFEFATDSIYSIDHIDGPQINGEETQIAIGLFSLGIRWYFHLF